MSEFINTVDQFGDDVVFESIVEGTITELKDDVLTNVNQYAFYMRTELKTIDFPSVLTVGISSFQGCSKLTDINLPLVESIGSGAFTNCDVLRVLHLPCVKILSSSAFSSCKILSDLYLPLVTSVGSYCFSSCYALTYLDFHNECTIENNAFSSNYDFSTLILRSETMCTLKNINAFNKCYRMLGTTHSTYNPDGLHDGYVYVPSALVETYQNDSVWGSSTLQFRALEDYTVDGTITGELDETKIHEAVEIADDWSTIMAAVEDGSYSSKYYVGDWKPLDLGTEGIVNMQIVAKDTDTLADGSGTAAVTWIAMGLLATTHRMNPARVTTDDGAYTEGTGAVGGWEKSEMRTYLKETIKPLILSEVSDKIVEVKKTQTAYDTVESSFMQETTDDVWIPDYDEVYTSDCTYKLCYPDNASRIKYLPTGSEKSWWLRHADNTLGFSCISTSGTCNNYKASSLYGVALGFCTGRTK